MRRLLAAPITIAADVAYATALFLDSAYMAVSGTDQEGVTR